MNKWFYRAVGSVGVAAGGFLLLGGGAAQAEDVDATPASDPLDLRGALDDFFTPTGGGNSTQVALGPNAKAVSSKLMMKSQLSDLRGHLSPTRDLGFVGAVPSSPTAAISPDMLGGGMEAAGTKKPALISTVPVAGSFTDDIGASRAVNSLGVRGTTNAVLGGANGISANGGGMRDLVPATSDVDVTRAGDALRSVFGLPAVEVPPGPADNIAKGNTVSVTHGTVRQTNTMVPAVIGDTMTAQSPELFTQTEARPPVTTLPVVGDFELRDLPGASGGPTGSPLDLLASLGLPSLPGDGATTLPAPVADDTVDDTADKPSKSRPHQRTAGERPIAGEDADYAEANSVGLPLIGDLSSLTRVLPTGGGLAGTPGM